MPECGRSASKLHGEEKGSVPIAAQPASAGRTCLAGGPWRVTGRPCRAPCAKARVAEQVGVLQSCMLCQARAYTG